MAVRVRLAYLTTVLLDVDDTAPKAISEESVVKIKVSDFPGLEGLFKFSKYCLMSICPIEGGVITGQAF